MANNKQAVAVAMAVALLALLFAAGEAAGKCNVDAGTVMAQCRSCSNGGKPSQGCCDALKNADFPCLCKNYWGRLKGTAYESCAEAIPSTCDLPSAKCH